MLCCINGDVLTVIDNNYIMSPQSSAFHKLLHKEQVRTRATSRNAIIYILEMLPYYNSEIFKQHKNNTTSSASLHNKSNRTSRQEVTCSPAGLV